MFGRLSSLGSRAGSLLLTVPVFGAAWLVFAIEPMLGKLLLPVLGGSPATWAACMVAFQLLLLGGYLYVYLGARYLELRWQALLHVLLLLASAVSLVQGGWGAPPELGSLPPALAVPWFVLRRVGLPYLALASTAPLLSRWAGSLGRPRRGLYAVSNVGALVGLLGYPLWLERFIALPAQLALWAAGFVLFTLGLLPGCLAVLRLSPASRARAAVRVVTPKRRKSYWLACAFVPSAMLLAVTNYLTVDVAAMPLLWVLPLAIYLGSFIVAFGAYNVGLRSGAVGSWLLGSAWLGLNSLAQATVSLASQVAAALLALLGAALLCHGELARERPSEGDESGFYLLLASGGALGGAFVGLLAPRLFSDFYELELSLLATFALLLGMARPRAAAGFSRPSRWIIYLGSGICLPLLLGEAYVRASDGGAQGHVVERRRGFLGPLRVVDVAAGRVLTHGRIQHGMQLRAPAERVPTLYFAAGTAVAQVLERFRPDSRRLGVVGLGVGTLASYGRAGDTLRFYELDRSVIELAKRDFTFLRDSAAHVTLVEGDGRLALAHEPAQAFDVLVLDAFSSDAVPVHLLTREAFETYAGKLAPDGVLLANVSNRHLAVERVVRASARSVGLACLIVETQARVEGHAVHVVWAVMGRDVSTLRRLLADVPLRPEREPEVLWTDSRASILSVLR